MLLVRPTRSHRSKATFVAFDFTLIANIFQSGIALLQELLPQAPFPMQDLPVEPAVLVEAVVAMVVSAVVSQVSLALQPATSVEDQTIMPVIARLRP